MGLLCEQQFRHRGKVPSVLENGTQKNQKFPIVSDKDKKELYCSGGVKFVK